MIGLILIIKKKMGVKLKGQSERQNCPYLNTAILRCNSERRFQSSLSVSALAF